MVTSRRALIWLTAASMLTAGCGGSASSTAPASPTPAPGPTAPQSVVITIAGGAVSPKNVVVPVGSQITFVNHDAVEHLMFSDPHPEHTDCPDINQVGYLTPGQTRQTGNLNIVRTCGFHDHERPTEDGLRGTITIQ
jgi:hypothetical protein